MHKIPLPVLVPHLRNGDNIGPSHKMAAGPNTWKQLAVWKSSTGDGAAHCWGHRILHQTPIQTIFSVRTAFPCGRHSEGCLSMVGGTRAKSGWSDLSEVSTDTYTNQHPPFGLSVQGHNLAGSECRLRKRVWPGKEVWPRGKSQGVHRKALWAAFDSLTWGSQPLSYVMKAVPHKTALRVLFCCRLKHTHTLFLFSLCLCMFVCVF